MNTEETKRRSTLKYADSSLKARCGQAKASKPKRRISFSGRKSVREFHTEEKPKSWNNSYEMLDHINSLENISTGNKPEDVLILQNSADGSTKHDPQVFVFEEDKFEHLIASKPIPTEITYYGKDDILIDDGSSSNANRNRLSELKSVEMDITNNKIAKRVSNQFTTITYESMDCNNSNVWEIEKINNAVVASPINTAVPMDISTHLNDSFRCVELLKSVECYNTIACNTSGRQKTNQATTIFEHEECKNIPSAKQVNTPKVIALRKVYTPTKTVLNDPTHKHNQHECENATATSRSDMSCPNLDSLSNIGINVDFNSPQCNLSPSFSCKSPLFPPIKCKKLNLRQLNAEIGDGKIVVFPNKNIESQHAASCSESSKNVIFKDHNETNSRKKSNLSNREEEHMGDISVKSNINETYFECEGILSDNTSFLVKEKLGDETALESTSKFCDDYRRDTIHFNSEIDTTFPHKVSCVDPFTVVREVEYVTGDLSNITLSNSDLTSNHYSINTKASVSINNISSQKCNNEYSINAMSIYEIQDMSLNKTNMEITTSVAPKSFNPIISEINDNNSRRLDITPKNAFKLGKQRKTIYLDQDMDTVSVLATDLLKSKCNHNGLGKIENNAFKCTSNGEHISPKGILMRQMGVEIIDSSSDSFVLNLKEARAALSSNCKRQIESTPHRSFLEFVCLEREVEQDQICTVTNAIEDVKNELMQPFVTKEITSRQNQKHIKGNENESEDNKKSHHNNLANTITENTSYHKEKLALRNQKSISHVNIDNSLSPILNSVTNKRITADLTPNFPLSKKRQTIIFHNCIMDESAMLSENEVLKKLRNSSTENADIKKKTFEFNFREAYVKTQDVLTLNESDKVAPANDCGTSKSNIANQTQDICGKTDNGIYHARAGNHQIDSIDMVSLQSRILSNSIASKINESVAMECSVDTIQLPRHALTHPDIRSSIIMHGIHNISDKITLEPENCKNFEYGFEENHITISDASAYCLAQQNFCLVEKIGDVQQDCLGDSNKTAVFNKEFINLERGNSPLCISETDDIEKTRLSLVETLLSENADDIDEALLPYGKENQEELNNHDIIQSCSALGKESNIDKIANVKNTTLCRRCKRCQEVLTSESMLATTESFALPSMPSFPCFGFERLVGLRKRPKLKDVHEYWRRRSLEKKEENVSAFAELHFKSEDDQNSECMNRTYIKDFEDSLEALKRIEKQIDELKNCGPLATDIFFNNLCRMLSEVSSNWILNYQMMARRIIQLSHKNCVSFSIEILYEDKDQLGNQISMQKISMQSGRIPSKLWKPIDHILDFNLMMSLPFGLKTLYSDNANEIFVLKLVQSVDGICNKELKEGLNLWRLLCNEHAALVRESNRVIVRKITREVVCEGADHYPFVKTTEFQIELNNVRTLSYKDIICPSLYAFCENLQFLPIGIDFLRIFLKSPSSYLRC